MDIENIYQFTTSIEQLKKIERFKGQFYWAEYPKQVRYESVADHTWRLSILVILFQNRLSHNLNLEKALKMALIHDLPEIIAGDASSMGKTGKGTDSHAFNKRIAKKRHDKEENAAKILFSKLPKKEAQSFFSLWKEYEEQNCFESKLVKSLDKIECMLQVLEYRKGIMFKDHLEFTIDYGSKGSEVDPFINKFAKLVAIKMRKNFRTFKKVKI